MTIFICLLDMYLYLCFKCQKLTNILILVCLTQPVYLLFSDNLSGNMAHIPGLNYAQPKAKSKVSDLWLGLLLHVGF